MSDFVIDIFNFFFLPLPYNQFFNALHRLLRVAQQHLQSNPKPINHHHSCIRLKICFATKITYCCSSRMALMVNIFCHESFSIDLICYIYFMHLNLIYVHSWCFLCDINALESNCSDALQGCRRGCRQYWILSCCSRNAWIFMLRYCFGQDTSLQVSYKLIDLLYQSFIFLFI